MDVVNFLKIERRIKPVTVGAKDSSFHYDSVWLNDVNKTVLRSHQIARIRHNAGSVVII